MEVAGRWRRLETAVGVTREVGDWRGEGEVVDAGVEEGSCEGGLVLDILFGRNMTDVEFGHDDTGCGWFCGCQGVQGGCC